MPVQKKKVILNTKHRVGVKYARKDNFERRNSSTPTILHEGSLLHEYTFAWIDFF